MKLQLIVLRLAASRLPHYEASTNYCRKVKRHLGYLIMKLQLTIVLRLSGI